MSEPRTRNGAAVRRAARRGALDTPLDYRPLLPTPRVDPDAFGRFAEGFARFMGTARFLVYMTGFVLLWIAVNIIGLYGYRWDPYPFILLNLFFSTQASYAAPLILLAQNRQDDRDRVTLEQDRARDERSLADTEYLAREVAALRIALRDVATRDFIRSELRDLLLELAEEHPGQARGDGADRPGRGDGPERPGRGDGADRAERADPGDRADRPGRADGPERPGRGERADRPGRGDRADRPARRDPADGGRGQPTAGRPGA